MRTDCLKYNRWRQLQQADSGGNPVNITQKYELIRPILNGQKTPKQASEETGIPLSTIYHYLKRFREGGGNIDSLADKSTAIHSHPKRLTKEDKDKVAQYKLHHPHLGYGNDSCQKVNTENEHHGIAEHGG